MKANQVFAENGLVWSQTTEQAAKLFESGYNCAQAVFGAFAERAGIPFDTAILLAGGFGGGIGRLREVCGAASGGVMAMDLLFGQAGVENDEEKAELYERTQTYVKAFEKAFGSYLCRELLELDLKNDAPAPEKRTPDYYITRPCALFVAFGAAQLEKILKEQTK